MRLSPTDALVDTCSIKLTIASIAGLLRIIEPAVKSWNISVDIIDRVPPEPVVIKLIVELDMHASSELNLRAPSRAEVSFNYCESSLDILVSWHWDVVVYLPVILVSHTLSLSCCIVQTYGL